jgi:hypothetical protein
MRTMCSLAGAALLAACLPARALDLEVPRTPTPCLANGPGFAPVPGTGTCLRIGGRVTAEAGTATGKARIAPAPVVGATGRVAIDARTETDLGPARTYIRLRAGSDRR